MGGTALIFPAATVFKRHKFIIINGPLYSLFLLSSSLALSRYFLRKLRRVKKANGQIIAVNEIFERNPTTVKNFGIWVRYNSRTGVHNAYKEYRDTTLNGAVEQLYHEMGSRHRVRASGIQIIKTATVKSSDTKRANIQQFHDSKIKFPLTRKVVRPSSRVFKTTFKAVRPSVAIF